MLIPRAMIVTPNIPEASLLSGVKIINIDSQIKAGKKILKLGPEYVHLWHSELTQSLQPRLGDLVGMAIASIASTALPTL